MEIMELKKIVAKGEDGAHQFKEDIRNVDSLASEMAAFANSEGGVILIGVSDVGDLVGLSSKDVARVNQLISNAASQHVRSPLIVHTENILLENQKVVILVSIPKGLDKPYFDKNGVIWLKCGSDKRKVNSKEELRRLFQMSGEFHADELPTKADLSALDRLRFRDFLKKRFDQEFPESKKEQIRLLQNMNLATDEGFLNLGGLLLFSEKPEIYRPQFIIKAASYPGNKIATHVYQDIEDFSGPLEKVFSNAFGFIMRNLRKIQGNQGVNAPGIPEVPPIVFEELLVNALVHRDYMVSAPIRVFIFDDRLEILSPGHLPNNLTVEKICAGNSNIRNPILASFAAKGLLPYRGLGSGIQRVLESWPETSFLDDPEANLFTCVIPRLNNC